MSVEQLVAQFALEAFAIAIFPRAPRLDVSCLGANGSDPLAKSDRNELRAIVCTTKAETRSDGARPQTGVRVD